MPDQLEAPDNALDLYLAQGGDINIDRPLMMGDVLDDIEIPGVDDGRGLAAIITHPCSMRRDGVHLAERLLVARVEPHPEVPFDRWAKGHFKILPLPELTAPGGDSYALKYELCGLVSSDILEDAERIVCLDQFGCCLLLQRLVHNQARVVVSTGVFHEAYAHVFDEAELMEDWVDAARAAGDDVDAAAVEFHTFLRAPQPGDRCLQDQLQDAAKRARIRRLVRQQIKVRFGIEAL